MLTWWLPGCINHTDTSFSLRFVLNTKGLRYSKVAMDYYERRLPFYHYQLPYVTSFSRLNLKTKGMWFYINL